MPGLKQKREVVAKTFGIEYALDPEAFSDDDVNYSFARRHLETVPGRIGRELAYMIEVQDVEELIFAALDKIYERDGERIFKEAVAQLRDTLSDASPRCMKSRRREELRAG